MESSSRRNIKGSVQALQKASSDRERLKFTRGIATLINLAQAGGENLSELFDKDAASHIMRVLVDCNLPYCTRELCLHTGQVVGQLTAVFGIASASVALSKLQGCADSVSTRAQLSLVEVTCSALECAAGVESSADVAAPVFRLLFTALKGLFRRAHAGSQASSGSTFRLLKSAVRHIQKSLFSNPQTVQAVIAACCKAENDDVAHAMVGVILNSLVDQGRLPKDASCLALKFPSRYAVDAAAFETTRPALMDSFVRSICGGGSMKTVLESWEARCWMPFLQSIPESEVKTVVAPVIARSIKAKPEALFATGPVLLSCGLVYTSADEAINSSILSFATSPKDELRDFAARLAFNAGVASTNVESVVKLAHGGVETIIKRKATVPLWQARHGLVQCADQVGRGLLSNSAVKTSVSAPVSALVTMLAEVAAKDTNEVVRKAATVAIGSWLPTLCLSSSAGAGATSALPKELKALFVDGLTAAALSGPADGVAEALYAATANSDSASAVAATPEVLSALKDFIGRSGGYAVANSKKTPVAFANLVFAVAAILQLSNVQPALIATLEDIRLVEPTAGSKTGATASKDAGKKPTSTTAGKSTATKAPTVSSAAAGAKIYTFWDLFNSAMVASAGLFSPALLIADGKAVSDVANFSSVLTALTSCLSNIVEHESLRQNIKAFSAAYVEKTLADLREPVVATNAGEELPKRIVAPVLSALVSLLLHPLHAVRSAAASTVATAYKSIAAPDTPVHLLLLHAFTDRCAQQEYVITPSFSDAAAVHSWTGIGDGPVARAAFSRCMESARSGLLSAVDNVPLHHNTQTKYAPGAVQPDAPATYTSATTTHYFAALKQILRSSAPVDALTAVVALKNICHPVVAGIPADASSRTAFGVPKSVIDAPGVTSDAVDPQLRRSQRLWGILLQNGATALADALSAHLRSQHGVWSPRHVWRVTTANMLAVLGSSDAKIASVVVQQVLPLLLTELQGKLKQLHTLTEEDLKIWRTPAGTLYNPPRPLSPFEENTDIIPLGNRTTTPIEAPEVYKEDWAVEVEEQLEEKRRQHASDMFSSAAMAAKTGKGTVVAPMESKFPARAPPPPSSAATRQLRPGEDPTAALLEAQAARRQHVQELYESVMGSLHAVAGVLKQCTATMQPQLVVIVPHLLPWLAFDIVRKYAEHVLAVVLRGSARYGGISADKLAISHWVHGLQVLQSQVRRGSRSHHACAIDSDVYGGVGLDLAAFEGTFKGVIHSLLPVVRIQQSESALSSFHAPQQAHAGTTILPLGLQQCLLPLARGILTAVPPLPVLQTTLQVLATQLSVTEDVEKAAENTLLYSWPATSLQISETTSVQLPPEVWTRASMVIKHLSDATPGIPATPTTYWAAFQAVAGAASTSAAHTVNHLAWRWLRASALPVLLHVLKVAPRSTPSPDHLIAVCSSATARASTQPSHAAVTLHEVQSALGPVGLLSAFAHVRASALVLIDTALQARALHRLPADLPALLQPRLFLATQDDDSDNANHARSVWEREGMSFADASAANHYVELLSHPDAPIRAAAAKCFAHVVSLFSDQAGKHVQATMDKYLEYCDPVTRNLDAASRTRSGALGCLAACAAAKVIPASLTPAVIPFLIQHGFSDESQEVQASSLAAGNALIDAYGATHTKIILTVLEAFLAAGASSPLAAPTESRRDAQREGVVILMGSAARYLDRSDAKLKAVIKVLLETLNTPSEPVQRSVAGCLAPLLKVQSDNAAEVVDQLLKRLFSDINYAAKRGAAFGLAGAVKGYGLPAFHKYGILTRLEEAVQDSKNDVAKQGALLAFECFADVLGMLFEPYVTRILSQLLKAFGDGSTEVREAAQYASKAVMRILTEHGVKLVVPATLTVLNETSWRSKHAAIQVLGYMGFCAPKQLGALLPLVVPKLCTAFDDAHPKVQAAGREALQAVGSVIQNPEVSVLVPQLLQALADNSKTKAALEALSQTAFVHAIDPPSLALLMPILIRGLADRATPVKVSSGAIVGNLCSLVSTPEDLAPYLPQLVPALKESIVDPIPDVRGVAALAFGSLIRGMGEAAFADLVPWLVDTMQSESSTVERSGAAQGMAEVLTALGEPKLSQIVAYILPLATGSKAAAREGTLWLTVFLPSVMGPSYSALINATLPVVLNGLADEVESVRDVAMRSGKVIVKQHARTDAVTIVKPLEAGLFSPSWRIRQSSIQLLGDLLSHISGSQHYSATVVAGNTDGITETAVEDDAFAEEEQSADELDEFASPEAAQTAEESSSEEEEEAAPETAAPKDAKSAAAKAAAAVRRKKTAAAAEEGSRKREDRKVASSQLGAKASGKDAEKKLAAARAKSGDQGTLDETYSVQAMDAASAAILRTLGAEARNRILAALYMVRCDMSAVVRQAALKVWKDVVHNTPRTLKEILPALMRLVIQALAGDVGERRLVAGRCLGDVVRKLGERVLPDIVPILQAGLTSNVPATRCGVCLGLAETIEAANRKQIECHMEVLMPAIRDALCDEASEVRDAAARAFNVLQNRVGNQAIEEIVPTLFAGIDAAKTEQDAARSIGGLKNIAGVRAKDILPFLLPRMLRVPITPSHAKALAAVAIVTGSVLHHHVATVLAAFMEHLDRSQQSADAITAEIQGDVGQAIAAVVQSVEQTGVNWTIGEIIKYFSDPLPHRRRAAAWTLSAFINGTAADILAHVPFMFKELLHRFVDTEEQVLYAAWDAMCTLVSKIPAEELVQHLDFVRSTISSMVSEARFRKGGVGATAAYYIPGFCLPKGLDAVLPIYLRALMHGNMEQRQVSAIAIREAVEATSPDAMKAFYVKVTGPLIRIGADKCPWQVKSAILETINLIIDKGGAALRPFQPQLQPTFSKSLADPTQLVRTFAAKGLGKLMPLAPRADPLVNELCTGATENTGGIQASYLEALVAVFTAAGEKVTAPVRAKTVDVCAPLLKSEETEVRRIAGAAIASTFKHADSEFPTSVLARLGVGSSSAGESVEEKDGKTAIAKACIKYAPVASAPTLSAHLVPQIYLACKEPAIEVRMLGAVSLGHLLAASESVASASAGAGVDASASGLSPEVAALYRAHVAKSVNVLVALLGDGDADVKKAAIEASKRFARYAPQVALEAGAAMVPVLTAFVTKEGGNMVLRIAAERALIYFTQAHKDETHLQALLRVVDASIRTFLGDFARKVLRKMDVDSDDEDEDM